MIARALKTLLVTLFWFPLIAAASPSGPLFANGAEKFALHDASGAEPKFKLLSSTPSRKALAATLATALNADPSTKPKLPVSPDGMNLTAQSLTFTPHEKNPAYMVVSLQVSGQNLTLQKLVKKEDIVSGKTIDYDIPEDSHSIALNSITSSGHMIFRYDSKKSELQIDKADGKLDFASPLMDSGEENVHFSGTGTRQSVN